MQYSFTALTLGALSAVVLSNPLPPASPGPVAPKPFGLIAIHSTTHIHNQAINAHDGKFYIGKPTLAYCPDVVKPCPKGDFTSFTVAEYNKAGYLGMDVAVPGGQYAYVASSGALLLTVPHSNAIPTGAQDDRFVLDKESQHLQFQSKALVKNASPWLACPLEKEPDVYQVFANTGKSGIQGCIDFEARMPPIPEGVLLDSPAAWQYESSSAS